MSNVNSNGKFGTSMDYSMMLRLKKHNVLTACYRAEVTPQNPVFNRDKKTRGFDNGVVDVLFQKGLYLANRNIGPPRGTLTYIYPLSNADNESFTRRIMSEGFPVDAYSLYLGSLQVYPGTPVPQQVLNAILPYAPLTNRFTDNTTGAFIIRTLIGNPVVDKAVEAQFIASLTTFPQTAGNSYTEVYTWVG